MEPAVSSYDRAPKCVDRVFDLLASVLFLFAAPFLLVASRRRWWLRLARSLQDWLGVTVLQNHYYEPVYTGDDVRDVEGKARDVPGIDMNLAGQLDILRRFQFASELRALEGKEVSGRRFSYRNPMLGEGDAEALYSFIRAFRPTTIVEIGAGHSTLVGSLAIAANRRDDPTYRPRHICFEPFENAWLETTAAEIRRERIERADLSVFRELKANDIVFLDSSHVVRSRSDVDTAFRRILPIVAKGVFVHIHDIFTPYDYPTRWLQNDRRFWTEQYLLEAFLSFNASFEVVLALHALHRDGVAKVREAFPMLARVPKKNPGSFWIRRCA